jgi:hypothetical protein
MSATTTYLTCKETAVLVRSALRVSFPGTRFSVRSHVYAGGASINVRWTDGPFQRDVQRVCDRYRGADFDPMQDLKTHRDLLLADTDGTVRLVQPGADYFFAHREWSDAYREVLRVAASKIAGFEVSGDGTTYITARDCYDNQLMQRLSRRL